MQIILKENVRALGEIGEVVTVSEGYGRNYLLPRKKGILATEVNLRRLETEKKSFDAKREKVKAEAEELAGRIQAASLILNQAAGEEDKLFGSVTGRQISEGLAEQGIVVDHRDVQMKEPIRTLGLHSVAIHLMSGVVANLTVDVRKK